MSTAEVVVDELLFYDPEPCETCDSGIAIIETFDTHKLVCRWCADRIALENGWNELPPPVDEPEHVPASEVEVVRVGTRTDPSLFDSKP